MKESNTKEPRDSKLIKASPTKDLFITMLVRDLTLRDAIGDLVDNSVDAAKSISNNGSYNDLKIDLTASPEKFIIEDNCGGFSVDVARNYAFCFGRPSGYPETPGSIGRFGIGMKRALFKLGRNFSVESTTTNSYFKMSVDVDKWNSDKNTWDFEFDDFKEGDDVKFDKQNTGTTIVVENLREDVMKQFSDPNFIKKLRSEIELEHLYAIHKGLEMKLNGKKLNERHLDFIDSEEIKPGYWEHSFYDGNLDVKVYSGISKDEGAEGGWYIFCNHRLIVGPDTSWITGWTGRKGDGVAEYHDQFHRFRGYVFFDAENAELLPWNTTKTGMDLDSPVYKAVRMQMIEMMKPVMTLMNILKKEKEGDTPEDERVFNNLVTSLRPVPLSEVMTDENKLPDSFSFPTPVPKEKKTQKGTRILYYKPSDEVNKVKEKLGITSNAEVGERTFEYFVDMEIAD
ncbi:ATP-binding protein [Ekhidna sp.]|uniref:ATP-binding protein n=1 Tax=Ekhidna sp. TaxID=2608089 RepID=UPI003B58B771